MNRTKYDGKLTDSLIQTVVEAERRQAGLVVTEIVNIAPSSASQETRCESDMANRTTEPLGGKDSIVRARPTPTEQAEAWRRSHYDTEPESDE